MSQHLTLIYHMPPVSTPGRPRDNVEAAQEAIRDRAIGLCEYMADRGVEDGYEITVVNLRTLRARAFTPQAALLLRLNGGYDSIGEPE